MPEADAALPVLERANVVDEIADTLVTKGSALAILGRMREGTAVLRGGLDLASANHLAAIELRARINLSSILAYDDLRAGAEIGRDGIDLAAQLGLRGRRTSLLVNAINLTSSVGDWDWCLSAADEIAAAEPDEKLRAAGFTMAAFIRFARGTAGRDDLDAYLAALADETEPNTLANVADVRATFAVIDGRLRDAIDDWRSTAELDPFSAAPALWFATDAALWLRDTTLASELLARFEATAIHGRFIDAVGRGLRAGLAALHRRPEAIGEYRWCFAEMRELGLLFEEARVAMTAAIVLGPDAPDARVAADHAREILGQLRATALADRFEAVLADAWGDAELAGPGEVPAADRTATSASGKSLESVG